MIETLLPGAQSRSVTTILRFLAGLGAMPEVVGTVSVAGDSGLYSNSTAEDVPIC